MFKISELEFVIFHFKMLYHVISCKFPCITVFVVIVYYAVKFLCLNFLREFCICFVFVRDGFSFIVSIL